MCKLKEEVWGVHHLVFPYANPGLVKQSPVDTAIGHAVINTEEGGALSSTSANTRAHYLYGCYGKDASCIPLPTNWELFSANAVERLLTVTLPEEFEGWGCEREAT